jgi:hypothetical protein
VLPESIIKGFGCKECMGKKLSKIKSKPYSVFVKELEQRNRCVEIVDGSTYRNSQTKIKVRYKACGHFNDVVPASLLFGHGCLICANNAPRYSEEWFLYKPEMRNHPALIYFIEFSDTTNFRKIGITRKDDISHRFKKSSYSYKTLVKYKTTLYEAYKIEQKIITEFSEYKYTPELLKDNGSSECFTTKLGVQKVRNFIKANTNKR